MKKTILLLIIVWTHLSNDINAQTYHYVPFQDSSATWLTNTVCAWSEGGTDVGYARLFYLNVLGDTQTVNGTLYRKMYQKTLPSDPLTIIGYLREDTAVRQIFFLYSDSPTEMILYDFSKQVGDTLQVNLRFCGECSVYQIINPIAVISAIDTVSYDSLLRKRFHFNLLNDTGGTTSPYANTYDIIEGIGSLGGVLNSTGFDLSVPDPCETTLSCYSYHDTTVYPSRSTDTCQIVLPVGISEIRSNHINLYPNPATGTLHLYISQPDQGCQLVLTDLPGSELLSQTISQTETSIDISHLASGIYIWRLTTADGTVRTGKVVKG